MPTHRKADSSIQAILTNAGGVTIYGQPRFRLVWGWDRLTTMGGKWFDYDTNGVLIREVIELREFPKYAPSNDFWYVEKWCPPMFYGPQSVWENAKVDTVDGQFTMAEMLGPYPVYGEYECSWRCALTLCRVHTDRSNCLPRCINSEYYSALEPTITMMEEYVARVLRSELLSDYERLKAIEREQEREEKDRDRVRKDIITDDNQLYTGSYVSVPSNPALDAWRKAKSGLFIKEN